MRYVSSVLWIVPLAVHVAYILATSPHLPPLVGVNAGAAGTPVTHFLGGWFIVITLANLAFVVIFIRLPRFGDRMLAVPGQEYWLSSSDRRADLVDRLRGICETALLGLNVFFLAVYQSIYQSNVTLPFLVVPMVALVMFFMVLPLLVAVIAILLTVRGLAAEANS